LASTRRFDSLAFLYAWLFDTKAIGAIAPSGAALADMMTREITPASAPVLELGPGTGVFTRALLARGLKETDLTLVESNEQFARLLQTRFPDARVLATSAARLTACAPASIGAVISGIPLLNLGPKTILGIMRGAFVVMRPDAAFYQFTYGPRCPVPRPILDRLGLEATRIGGALRNVPPASVYKVTRRHSSPDSARAGASVG
jgi:phospholipid N-methyltransferase